MLTLADFAFVRDLIRSRSGVVLDDEKNYMAESRLRQLATGAGLKSAADVVTKLRAGADVTLVQKVVEAMTTNETYFFRDGHPFDLLRTTLIPELIRARAAERRLAIWCGASSTGQEPYSVAILLREHFPELAAWDVRFVATDLSEEVLARARAGRYSQLEVNRGMPAALLRKYFDQAGAEWVVRDAVRRAVEFRQLNLLDDRPNLPPLDLVLLRNVLIYFAVPTKKAILARVRRLLRPDGYLLLGGSETTWNLDDGFERIPAGGTHYYRPLGARTPAPAAK